MSPRDEHINSYTGNRNQGNTQSDLDKEEESIYRTQAQGENIARQRQTQQAAQQALIAQQRAIDNSQSVQSIAQSSGGTTFVRDLPTSVDWSIDKSIITAPKGVVENPTPGTEVAASQISSDVEVIIPGKTQPSEIDIPDSNFEFTSSILETPLAFNKKFIVNITSHQITVKQDECNFQNITLNKLGFDKLMVSWGMTGNQDIIDQFIIFCKEFESEVELARIQPNSDNSGYLFIDYLTEEMIKSCQRTYHIVAFDQEYNVLSEITSPGL